MADFHVYVDTEYCYPGMKKTDPRPTEKDTRQIVQVAAIVYDNDKGIEVASFDMLARPTFEKQVTPFFTELTGITQDQIDTTAYSFSEALAAFRAFCADYPVWTFEKDEEVFRQNCTYINAEFPFAESFTKVKPLLAGWGIDSSQYSSGSLYKAAGISMQGHVHNALHDVRSMAAAVREFERRAKAN